MTPTIIFELGDRVRRIHDNWRGVHVGEIYTVLRYRDSSQESIYLVELGIDGGSYTAANFELVERAEEPKSICNCIWNRHPLYCKCKNK